MDIDDPVRGSMDAEGLATANEQGPDGYFPIGRYSFWHGGVHVRTSQPIVAIRDGLLVAYRIDKKPQTVELEDKKSYEFSTGFALLQHETATPLGHKIKFWSLYMHLLHWDAYVADPALEPPVYLRAMHPDKVKSSAEGKGLRLAGDAGAAATVGVVPKNGIIVLTGLAPDGHWTRAVGGVFARGRWGQLEGWLKVDDRTRAEPGCKTYLSTAAVRVVSAKDPETVEGTIPPNSVFEVGTELPSGSAWSRRRERSKLRAVSLGALKGFAFLDNAIATKRRVVVEVDSPGDAELGVAVHAQASAISPVIAILRKGTAVRFKDPTAVRFTATTTYPETLDGGFVAVNKANLEEVWTIGDAGGYKVVIPKKPMEIHRGDVLGWPGIGVRPVQAPGAAQDTLVHFEVFTDSVDFLTNPKNEHWFCDSYRLPAGRTLKRSERLPAAQNPELAVDLPAGSQLRIAERFEDSQHVKAFRHEVTGWRRISELGEFHDSTYILTAALEAFYAAAPACWCKESSLAKVPPGLKSGDYADSRGKTKVPETFQRVRHERPGAHGPVVTEGWAREHALGDLYAEAYRAERAPALALSAKPPSWIAADDTASDKRIAITAGTWLEKKSAETVSQSFRRVKLGDNEGWIAKERLATKDAAKHTAKVLVETRLLKNVPVDLDGQHKGAAVTILAKDAEVTDLGFDSSAAEPWVHVAFFRDATGTIAGAWVRASELGTVFKDRYVLTADLAELLEDKPSSLLEIEKKKIKKLPIGAAARDALESLHQAPHVAEEPWESVEVHGTGRVGWARYCKLDDASHPLANHYILAHDLDHVLPSEPAQVALGAVAGNSVNVLGEKTSAGVAYLHIERGGRRGWWPKDELGTDDGATRQLTRAVPHVLRDEPKDPPDRVTVHAAQGDAVVKLKTSGAFAQIRVVVTRDAERYPGFLPAANLDNLPSGRAAFASLVSLKAAKSAVWTYDPDATYVFDKNAGQVPAERGEVAGKYEFKRSAWRDLRRDKDGHLWTEVDGRGWVDLHLDITSRKYADPDLTGASAYNWTSWRKYQEEASAKPGEAFFSQDGLCDVPGLITLIEADQQGKPRTSGAIDKEITAVEMKAALTEPRVRDQLRSAACRHPSEWDAADNKKWDRLKKPPWNMAEDLFKSHMNLIEKQQFWKDAFAKAPLSSMVWHLHPLGFVKQLRTMQGVTVDQILRIMRNARGADVERYIAYLNGTMEHYEINTPLLQAHFLAQLGVESAHLSSGEEGRFYRQPPDPKAGEQYELRLDMDNVKPGDGKRFKGRGLIQLTGRRNYSVYSAYVGIDLTAGPDQLFNDPRLMCDVSGWFWRRGAELDLNTVATGDSEQDVRIVGSYINMGRPKTTHDSKGKVVYIDPIGHKERYELFRNARRVLSDH